MFIDTHAHLYDERFATDETEMLERCVEAGISKIFLPNCDQTTIAPMLDLCARYPTQCYPMIGLHPCYVKDNYKTELNLINQWIEKKSFAAVGEIGLDYYWDKTFIKEQKEAFETQIDWALERNLPIIIHSRDSNEDCIDIVKKKQNGKLKGIFHCFSGSLVQAQKVVDLGFYLGIGGVVTYKKNILQNIVAEIPLEHLVLETDAPYLTPEPFRGKRNESSYIKIIAEKVAVIKNITLEEVARVTTLNATNLFGI